MPEFYNNTNITNQIKFIGRADLSTTSRAMVLAYKVQRGQMVSTQWKKQNKLDTIGIHTIKNSVCMIYP